MALFSLKKSLPVDYASPQDLQQTDCLEDEGWETEWQETELSQCNGIPTWERWLKGL